MQTKPVGAITRGTTNPNRLRRVDNWIAYRCASLLASSPVPLVIDLGFGATPVTSVELHSRLTTALKRDIPVVGLEIDPRRVAAAQGEADPPHLEFRLGGFELAGFLMPPRKMKVTTVSTTRIDAAPIVQPTSSFVLPRICAGGSPPRRQRNLTS